MASSLLSNSIRAPPFHRLTFFLFQFQSQSLSRSSHSQKCTISHPPSTPLPPTNPTTRFDHETVRETLISYNNDWKQALEFFHWVETQSHFQHSTDTFNCMIDILGKFFEFDRCWDLIQRMQTNPSSFPNHTTFRVMFKRYVSAHSVNEAFETFQRLQEFNLKDPTSFSNLIDALCEYKHVFEAQDLIFGKNNDLGVDGFDVGTKVYNMVLRGWFKIGWWSRCKEFWEEMDRKGVQKDMHSYSLYMDIMCKKGKPWKAVKLFKEMKSKGIKLDVVVYNIVIRAVGVSKGVDFSIRKFREMKELGVTPTVVTYNTIMKLLCESYRYKEALALLSEMKKGGSCEPNAASYHCFFASMEKPKEIMALFDRMIESGVRPTIDTYVMLMRKFGKWGFLRLVLKVWEKMEELGCSPDASAYNALIDALVEKGLIEMARKYDEEMLAKGLSAKPRKELGTKLVVEEEEYVEE